jgi:pimeloyl-ACP methyl ester carboxylesterase
MIAQTVAAHRPDRVHTLVSIMSTTGARRVGRPALSTWARMSGRPARTRQESADRAVRMFRHIGSRGFPFDEAAVRTTAEAAWDRDPTADGAARQLAAILAAGDRTAEVGQVRAPSLVIHGDRDRMVHPSGGQATQKAIAGSRLVVIPGMGHDLPAGAWARLADLIGDHASRAQVRGEHPGSGHAASPAGPARPPAGRDHRRGGAPRG